MIKEHKKFSKEEVDDIKRWAHSHIISIFNFLQIKFTDSGKYLTAKCPIPYHGGDGNNPKAFVWSFDKTNWRCYTHQCQEDTGSDIVGLVMALKEMAFPQAVNFLYELKNGILKNIPEEQTIKREHQEAINTPIDINKLKILMSDIYFYKRGISPEILKKHKVGYWQKMGTFMDRRAIVPVFDANNNLVGFSGRIVDDNTEQAKWVHGRDFVTRKAGTFNKSSVLYNLNNCIDTVKQTKKVYIVEGPIDLWKLEMAGIKNVVATLGLGLTFEQQKLLISLGVETIVICYDNDENHAGQNAANRIMEQVNTLFSVIIKIPQEKDFGEMSISEIIGQLL